MKGCADVQWNSVHSRKDFRLERSRARDPWISRPVLSPMSYRAPTGEERCYTYNLNIRVVNLKAPKMNIAEFANSINQDISAHNECIREITCLSLKKKCGKRTYTLIQNLGMTMINKINRSP